MFYDPTPARPTLHAAPRTNRWVLSFMPEDSTSEIVTARTYTRDEDGMIRFWEEGPRRSKEILAVPVENVRSIQKR